MVVPTLSVILSESWGNTLHMVKDNGFGWLRWLLKQGRVILVHTKHRDYWCALELPFARHDILHPFKLPRSLLTSQRKKGRHSWPWNVDSLECR
jgi:hypothetical protein